MTTKGLQWSLIISLAFSVLADVGAAHVLSVPRLHVCPAVDDLLRAGSCCSNAAESEPNRVFLHCHPHRPGVLESGYTQHPAAHGTQQSSECLLYFSIRDLSTTQTNNVLTRLGKISTEVWVSIINHIYSVMLGVWCYWFCFVRW